LRDAVSPSDAALEGFRILRRRPEILIIWAGLFLLVSAAALALVWSALSPDLGSLLSAIQARVTPTGLQPVAQKVRDAQLLLTPLTAALQAVLGTAVLRAVIRPDSRNIGYLGFGGDEFRVFLVQTVYGLVMATAMIAWVLFVVTFTAIGIAAAGLNSAEIGKAVLGAVLVCVLIGGGGGLYLAIRLSLAAPMTLAAREFRFFESWGQTKGWMGRLAMTYLLAFFLYLVTSLTLLVVGIVLGGVVFLASGGGTVLAEQGIGLELVKVAWPALLIGWVPVSLASVMTTVVLQAPAARIYMSIAQDVV
jgi:hypothetical protein